MTIYRQKRGKAKSKQELNLKAKPIMRVISRQGTVSPRPPWNHTGSHSVFLSQSQGVHLLPTRAMFFLQNGGDHFRDKALHPSHIICSWPALSQDSTGNVQSWEIKKPKKLCFFSRLYWDDQATVSPSILWLKVFPSFLHCQTHGTGLALASCSSRNCKPTKNTQPSLLLLCLGCMLA